jgi:hypothetical protein
MRCIFEYEPTPQERAIVDEWIMATDCVGVTEIVVESSAVIVRDTRHHPADVAGTALRHGELFADLTKALDAMRRNEYEKRWRPASA